MLKKLFVSALFCLALVTAPVAHASQQDQENTLALGYFPNITHAHALIAQNMAREGQGWFERYLPGVIITWHSFNAGPSAMEALFAKAVDATYVGPSPVLNAFVRSKGGVAVVSGAVRGGAGLVVPKDSALHSPEDFRGKKIATPQLANTQDIACRSWLIDAGLRITMGGGDATIVPTSNPFMIPLFSTGEIDAAWTVEPWLSRLEMEADGLLIYAEPAETSLTTVLAAGTTWSEKHPELLTQLVAAHHDLSAWILANPAEAQKRVAEELSAQMRNPFPLDLVEHAWPRLIVDNAVSAEEFTFSLQAAQKAGFLRGNHELDGLVSAP